MQSFGSKRLDASLLLIPLVGFLPPDDPRVRGTLKAIEERLLVQNEFVLRYETEDGVDGLPPGEGAFLACSFWLVDNYLLQDRHEDARRLFERLLARCNDVGLLAEEFDPVAGRMLGNFPQAYSHVGLINSALSLSEYESSRKRAGRAPGRPGEARRQQSESSAQAASPQSNLTSFLCRGRRSCNEPGRTRAEERSGGRPPDFRHVAIGRAARDDMAERRKVEVDAGDAQLVAGNELEHLPSPLCCGSRIDVVSDARIGEGELHSWKVDDVAPDEKPVAAGLNEPCGVARRMARCGEGAHTGGDLVRLDRADPIAIGGERRASEAEVALAFRGRARHRPLVSPKVALVPMQETLRPGEYSLSGRVDKPRLVIRMHVSHTIESMSAGATPMAFRFPVGASTRSVFPANPASTSRSSSRLRITKQLMVSHGGQGGTRRDERSRRRRDLK